PPVTRARSASRPPGGPPPTQRHLDVATARSAFFFSSSRRHTRSDRDWSSDVCSSDLATRAPRPASTGCPIWTSGMPAPASTRTRSEERRVGKECRNRWWKELEKKKSVSNDAHIVFRTAVDSSGSVCPDAHDSERGQHN